MKIYGFYGVLFSVLAFGSVTEGQIFSNSDSSACQNCSQAVNFSDRVEPLQTAVVNEVVDSSQMIYQDSAVAPATYNAPQIMQAPVTTTTYSQPIAQQPVPPAPVSSLASNVRTGLAQTKAATAARIGLRGHLGGGLGGANYEGVGWSSQSAQSAIQNCCYWGTRPVSQIGVAKGSDGCWYACVLYQ
jgi:hypothetical protein